MDTQFQKLKELDLRDNEQKLNPIEFMNSYIASNFPQTVAHPSKQQKGLIALGQMPSQAVNYMKKPSSGISFDNPAAR